MESGQIRAKRIQRLPLEVSSDRLRHKYQKQRLTAAIGASVEQIVAPIRTGKQASWK
jgi:hypothetical protein